MEGEQVFGSGYFGGGVALECHTRVVMAHSLAIVHYLDESAACILYNNLYL